MVYMTSLLLLPSILLYTFLHAFLHTYHTMNPFIIDLETPIMKKGFKRKDVLIFSIGCISLLRPEQTFHCFVNINDKHYEKLNMPPTNSIKSKINYDATKALPIGQALDNLFQFTGKNPLFIAHNGNSFDFKIIEGAIQATKLGHSFQGLDSYHHIVKKVYSLPSYKLSNVYFSICDNHEKLTFHRAIDDCIALKEICIQCAKTYIQQDIVRAYKELYGLLNEQFNTNFHSRMIICHDSFELIRKSLKEIKICDKLMQMIVIYCLKKWSTK